MLDGPDLPYLQVGALPYRFSPTGEVTLMLVTSRGTRQWIIPKGWPVDGLSKAEAAAREAYEEAGIFGEIGKIPVGTFAYEKARKGETVISPFSVEVYLLRVERQLTCWPEAEERSIAWVTVRQALSMITNASLKTLVGQTRFPVA